MCKISIKEKIVYSYIGRYFKCSQNIDHVTIIIDCGQFIVIKLIVIVRHNRTFKFV